MRFGTSSDEKLLTSKGVLMFNQVVNVGSAFVWDDSSLIEHAARMLNYSLRFVEEYGFSFLRAKRMVIVPDMIRLSFFTA